MYAGQSLKSDAPAKEFLWPRAGANPAAIADAICAAAKEEAEAALLVTGFGIIMYREKLFGQHGFQ